MSMPQQLLTVSANTIPKGVVIKVLFIQYRAELITQQHQSQKPRTWIYLAVGCVWVEQPTVWLASL
jgi:hypothetical protein